MPAFSCLKGHDSTEPDFCSVCGAKLQPVSLDAAVCPDCGAAREATGGMFCEICGFNFTTGAHGELKPAVIPPAPAPPVIAPPVTPPPVQLPPISLPDASVAETAPRNWEVIVTVDAAARDAESPEPPADFAALTLPLEHESSLIGRRSERRAIDPEIALDHDDAVSHRHALLTRTADGVLTLRDIGSANGTALNGALLAPLTDVTVNEGDVIAVGHWTRIAIKALP